MTVPESSDSPCGGEEPFDVEELARQTAAEIEETDWAADSLENRVVRLEEIIAARWPRSWLLRRRLAREMLEQQLEDMEVSATFAAVEAEVRGDG